MQQHASASDHNAPFGCTVARYAQVFYHSVAPPHLSHKHEKAHYFFSFSPSTRAHFKPLVYCSPWVAPGEAVCVKVDWTMANELTLVGINDMYTKIGRPGVANKDRVWLAVDHTVDPRNYQ
jgi:hypothetical protein